MTTRFRTLVSWTAWPALLVFGVLGTAFGFRFGYPIPAFYVTYGMLTGAVLLLERWMPHEVAWTKRDGQLVADVSHTLVSNVAIEALVTFSGAIGLSAAATALGGPRLGVWPHHWPLAAQVMFGLAASELGLYWAHRLAHEWPALWHFHAIHHSVERLWIVNSGRFHFIDAVKSVAMGLSVVLLLGAPMDVLIWLSALGAFIGTLTHCNVAMRFGWLSAIFNTPELHRWHHSKDLREGNTNYGENLMLWDWAFGSYFNEARRPPADIGIQETMPPRFRDQIVWPFKRLLSELPTRSETIEQE